MLKLDKKTLKEIIKMLKNVLKLKAFSLKAVYILKNN